MFAYIFNVIIGGFYFTWVVKLLHKISALHSIDNLRHRKKVFKNIILWCSNKILKCTYTVYSILTYWSV